ncbi:adenosine kinase [Aestuariicella hydrocarbonica]|uniref:Adenosine kinase n=1 Tax=Pseudomaricurvus hydrocarbonicus TaxID=1470433 RepID=A0A9E5T1Y5_9GAMM|nr:adenosine kinase [Aestuariicella hydrocarbonica]NHO67261.1 adenosine kinase [Aestuariicella hydrocarbonica]
MAKYHIYGLGAALVDTEIEVSDQDLSSLNIEKGLMTLVDSSRQQELIAHLNGHLVASKRASGGSAANTIIAASYFGAKSFYSCKVAADENGDFYLQDLNNAGVDYHRELHRQAGDTGKCLVMITPDAERTMNTYLGISETLSVAELHEDAIAVSEYLYLEGYLVTSDTGRAAAIRARQLAEASAVKVAISLSDPGIVQFFRDGLLEMIGNRIDLLFCNKDEALSFTGVEALEDAIDQLKRYARTFAITLGANGALVHDGKRTMIVPSTTVKAIDTNGAGDMFAGAFLYAITHGYCFEQAAELANKAAGVVVSQFGPRLSAEQHHIILSQ